MSIPATYHPPIRIPALQGVNPIITIMDEVEQVENINTNPWPDTPSSRQILYVVNLGTPNGNNIGYINRLHSSYVETIDGSNVVLNPLLFTSKEVAEEWAKRVVSSSKILTAYNVEEFCDTRHWRFYIATDYLLEKFPNYLSHSTRSNYIAYIDADGNDTLACINL